MTLENQSMVGYFKRQIAALQETTHSILTPENESIADYLRSQIAAVLEKTTQENKELRDWNENLKNQIKILCSEQFALDDYWYSTLRESDQENVMLRKKLKEREAQIKHWKEECEKLRAQLESQKP